MARKGLPGCVSGGAHQDGWQEAGRQSSLQWRLGQRKWEEAGVGPGGTQRACVTRCKSAIQESVPLVEVTASLKLSRAPYFVCVMHDKREESPETAHAMGNRMEKRVTGSFTGLKKLIKCEKKEKRAATRSNDKLEDLSLIHISEPTRPY